MLLFATDAPCLLVLKCFGSSICRSDWRAVSCSTGHRHPHKDGGFTVFSSLVFRMKNRMFIVPCFIFVSFKCCTFGWLAKHEWEQAKAFFLCCLGIRWEAQNYYFGFRDDTGKTLMFSEVWNNRWFLMRLKKTPNQPCVICLQFRFLACRQQIKIRWNDCVSADFLIFHFLKVVPPVILKLNHNPSD